MVLQRINSNTITMTAEMYEISRELEKWVCVTGLSVISCSDYVTLACDFC